MGRWRWPHVPTIPLTLLTTRRALRKVRRPRACGSAAAVSLASHSRAQDARHGSHVGHAAAAAATGGGGGGGVRLLSGRGGCGCGGTRRWGLHRHCPLRHVPKNRCGGAWGSGTAGAHRCVGIAVISASILLHLRGTRSVVWSHLPATVRALPLPRPPSTHNNSAIPNPPNYPSPTPSVPQAVSLPPPSPLVWAAPSWCFTEAPPPPLPSQAWAPPPPAPPPSLVPLASLARHTRGRKQPTCTVRVCGWGYGVCEVRWDDWVDGETYSVQGGRAG